MHAVLTNQIADILQDQIKKDFGFSNCKNNITNKQKS